MRRLPLVLLVSLVGALSARAAGAVVVQINSNIASNTSWGLVGSGSTQEADVFWIRNSISVNSGVTLTLKPGIVVKFDAYSTLTVNGALQAVGTGASLIYFTSYKDDARGGDTPADGPTTGSPSDWGGITIGSVSPDSSRLVFCDIAYAGYYQRGALTFASGVAGRISHSSIRNSYFGVDVQGNAPPSISDVSIQGFTVAPIALDLASVPVLNTLSFAYLPNTYNAFYLRGGTLNATATLPKRAATVGATPSTNVPYVLSAQLDITSPGNLTVASGVVVKPLGGCGITVESGATLSLSGAAGDSVVFTSINDDNAGIPGDTNDNGSTLTANRGDWDRIAWFTGSAGSVQYARLSFGTTNGTNAMLDVTDVNLAISNSTLTGAVHGVAAKGVSAATLTNVAINAMSSTPVLMSVRSNPSFTGTTFGANALTALGLIGENVSASAHLVQRSVGGFSNITYDLQNGTLDMGPGTTLTIDPGVVIKTLGGNVAMVIEGTITANGSVSSPIVFTSERDDAWGNPGDTNGNGLSPGPAVGDWSYLRLTPTASASSIFNFCRFQYGGQGPFDNFPCSLWLNGCAPTLSNCNFNYGYYAIRLDGAVAPTLGIRDTVTNCVDAPILMSVTSNPSITQSFFKNNGINGLALLPENVTSSSTIRYRPAVTMQAPDPAVPLAYVLTGGITVAPGVTLAIEPQVVLKVLAGSPAITVNGTLNVNGSGPGSNRVIFTSFRDDTWGGDTNNDHGTNSPLTGDWGTAIQFNSTSTACILRYVLFTFGGYGGASTATVTTYGCSPRIARTDFQFDTAALTFNGASSPASDTVSILNCTTIPVAFSLLGNPTFSNITWSGNPYTVLGLIGEGISQNVTLASRTLGPGIFTNIAYAPIGDITIGQGATWTINPGIVIKLGRYGTDPTGNNINIDGALVANGTLGSPIVFTSMADDAFGGDNNNDGLSTAPVAGQWGALNFSALSNSATTIVNNVKLRYGGYFSTPGLTITNTNTSISNTMITAAGEGVRIAGAAAPVLNNVSVDSCVTMPIRMSLVSNPTFTNVQFAKNGLTGLGVISETIAQDLLWRIRPLSGRLNMPYIVDGGLAVGLGSTLTMQPGLIVKFRAGWGGSLTINRAITANGVANPESLIVFTSSRDDFYGGRSDTTSVTTPPAPGDWYSVGIQNTAIGGQVKFANCVFRYGGYSSSNGALRAISSSPTVDHSVFAYNSIGVSVEGAGNPVIHTSSFYGNTYYAVTNTGTSFCTDATGCWWGAASGPNDPSAAADVCGAGQTNLGGGDPVTNNVNYGGFATAGVLSPVLGDVTLNGTVSALDASYILQFLASTLALNPLQQQDADVDLAGGITSLDASLILQFVTGSISALPANRTGASPATPDVPPSIRDVVRRAHGTFEVSVGASVRSGDHWSVPVSVTGDAPIFGAELHFVGANAGSLAAVSVAGGALSAFGTPEGTARMAFAASQPIPAGEMVTLEFPAGASTQWDAPRLAWARVNNDVVALAAVTPATPGASFLAPLAQNPARGPVALSLGLSARDATTRVRVEVLDLAGRRVRTLQSGPLDAGVHDLVWDLRDASGAVAAPGVYLVRAEAGRFSAVRRLVVVR